MLSLQLCIINANLTSTGHRYLTIEFRSFHFYSLEIGCDCNNGDCVAACVIRVTSRCICTRYIIYQTLHSKKLFVCGIAIAHVLEITNDDETDSEHHNINFVRTLCISVYFVTYDELYLTVTRFVDFPFINKLSHYRLLCLV